jgi:hypothetical protein
VGALLVGESVVGAFDAVGALDAVGDAVSGTVGDFVG